MMKKLTEGLFDEYAAIHWAREAVERAPLVV
jgi:hypothetical protein